MANLVDTSVNGDLRVTGTMFGTQAGNYATCATAAGTAAKAVTISGFTLTTGIHVFVKFTVTNTAAVASLTLNVSGTGAKAMKYRGGNLPAVGTLSASRVYEFIYDGANWELVGDLDTFPTLPLSVENGGTGATTAANAANNILSALPVWTTAPTDNVKLIRRDLNDDATFGQVTFLSVWNYIKDKISSVLGLTKTAYGGNAATATKATQDSDGNAINATYFKSNAGTTTLQSGAAVKVGTQNGADVKLQLPAIPTATTTTPKMDGTAAVGSETTWARGDHVHPSDTSREAVSNKTTVVQGTSDSKYPTDKAVADFVNSSVATNTANYISNDGEPFTSVTQLEAYAGTVTNNDYAFVTGTDAAGNTYYDRYKATVSGSAVTWALEYRLNNSSFTAAQWAAINSGITAALVGKIHEHSNKAVLDGITATDVSNWNNKKDKQTAVTFTGSTLKTPTSMTQDANGAMAVTFTDIQSASTSQKGIVQLSDATNSTSTALAATANAVKTAYDLAASKQGTVSTDTDSSEFGDATTIATGFGSNKIHLNVASRLWNYIKGKLGISSSGSSTKFLNERGEWATVTTPDVSGKADKVTGATAGDVATLDANGNLVDSDMTLGKSVPADAVFTDSKVMQTKDDSGTTAYPLLMAGAANPNGTTATARYDSAVKLNPSTNTISANISGNAASADAATIADIASATSSGAISANTDLNDLNTANRNYLCKATNTSTVRNKPSGASGAFELEVIRGTGDTCVQIYYNRDNVNSNYIRKHTGLNDGTWTDWVKLIDSSDGVVPTYLAYVNISLFADVKAAYTAGKRIIGAIGGTTSAGNLFRQEAPLGFATFTDNEPTAFTFLFENARPKTEDGDGLGSTTRWTVSSSGWAVSTDNIDYAETAGTANTANSATTANSAATLSSILPKSKGGTGFGTVDTAPTKDSNKMVTSGGVWNDTPSPIAHYIDTTGIAGIYGTTNRADEVVIRNGTRFRLSTLWLKNFSGRTFKIHNAKGTDLEISVQVEAGLKLVLTDELNVVKTYDNTSGSSDDEDRDEITLLPGETLRLYVIYTSGSTEIAVFLVGSGRWSLFQPAYDKYRSTTGISYYQRLCYAKTTGNPGSKGNVHMYDGTNWHNLCNLSSSSGIVRIAGLNSSRSSSRPTTAPDYNMNIITGLTIARQGYMGMLYGYVVPNYSTAARLPTASSDTATSYYQSGKTMANCSQLKIDGFAEEAVGSGHAVYTGSSLLHVALLSGTLTFSINGDFSLFTQGAQYFFSIPVSFGSLTE